MAPHPPPDFAETLAARFPLATVPNVPEIRLHRAGPESGLWRLAAADDAFGNPYWAYHWGGGLALARHVLDHPQLVSGRRVLDLGAGSGLVAIAAALSGAADVIAADTDPYSVAVVACNAAANGVTVTPLLADLTAGPPPDVDLILAGDVFYNADLAARMTGFLDHCLAANVPALIGDPGRTTLPLDRLQELAVYPGPDFGRAKIAPNAVFAWRPK